MYCVTENPLLTLLVLKSVGELSVGLIWNNELIRRHQGWHELMYATAATVMWTSGQREDECWHTACCTAVIPQLVWQYNCVLLHSAPRNTGTFACTNTRAHTHTLTHMHAQYSPTLPPPTHTHTNKRDFVALDTPDKISGSSTRCLIWGSGVQTFPAVAKFLWSGWPLTLH